MIYWLRLFGLIACVIGIIAVIGSVLPRSYDFEVAQTIEAEPQIVYDNIDTFTDWQWSQWTTENPNIEKLKYLDDGRTIQWTDIRGDGEMKIVATEPAKMVHVTSNYSNFPEMVSTFEISESGGFTIITWNSKGELPPGPFYGYFSAFFPNGMRSQYAVSLEKLRLVCEK